MVSRLYKRFSGALLCLVALSFPYLVYQARTLPANNDIETWIPKGSDVRATYEKFKRDFGVEELILIALPQEKLEPRSVEAVCSRIDRLPGVRQCWSPSRMQSAMYELGVSTEQSRERLTGLSLSKDGKLLGLVVLLSDAGLKDRAGTVKEIRRELDYCQLRGSEVSLAGAPVIVAELDRLGGQAENQKFFLITLLICLGLLYYWIRDWKLTFSILGLTLWAINLTLTLFKFTGGEMNFILGALSVMVMVFTLEASIHVLHYHKASLGSADPVGEAFKLSWKPCGMSMLTTAIGLFSVSVSDILPVTQFGFASALGAVVAALTGLCITPALLVVLPPPKHLQDEGAESPTLSRLAMWLVGHNRLVVSLSAAMVVVSCVGLFRIHSKIDPLDFLPKNGKVLSDVRRVEAELTNLDSIEAVVDFEDSKQPFVERLEIVRELEQKISGHAGVRHTMSLASFFPHPLPESPLVLMNLLKRAESKQGQNDFLTSNQRLWRISARVVPGSTMSHDLIHRELEALTAGAPIHFTGIAPLLERAQHQIFDGFWKSFTSALLVIALVMTLSLRSVKTAVLSLLPNLAPICMVFGALGWLGVPVDIGMMMTGSIALGITVDGTYHLLARFQEQMREGERVHEAVRAALASTGGPIFESIVVSSIGMLALTLSSFAPTARFGLMMSGLLIAALAGGLVLLPAMLSLQREPKLAKAPNLLPAAMAKSHRLPRQTALRMDQVA